MGNVKGNMTIKKNDILYKRFGKLTVAAYTGYKYVATAGGDRVRHFYKCKCDCGSNKVVQRDNLLGGLTKSCGCSKRGRRKHGR